MAALQEAGQCYRTVPDFVNSHMRPFRRQGKANDCSWLYSGARVLLLRHWRLELSRVKRALEQITSDDHPTSAPQKAGQGHRSVSGLCHQPTAVLQAEDKAFDMSSWQTQEDYELPAGSPKKSVFFVLFLIWNFEKKNKLKKKMFEKKKVWKKSIAQTPASQAKKARAHDKKPDHKNVQLKRQCTL